MACNHCNRCVQGWFRECSIISHTHDLDFSIRIEEIDEDLISEIESSFRMKHTLGTLFNI